MTEAVVIALVCVGIALLAAWAAFRSRRKLKLLSSTVLIVYVCWLLSIANMAIGVGLISYGLYGGTPQNGMVKDGKYYVGNHGRYKEVSESFFHRDALYVDLSEAIATATTLAMIPVMIFVDRRGNKGSKPGAGTQKPAILSSSNPPQAIPPRDRGSNSSNPSW